MLNQKAGEVGQLESLGRETSTEGKCPHGDGARMGHHGGSRTPRSSWGRGTMTSPSPPEREECSGKAWADCQAPSQAAVVWGRVPGPAGNWDAKWKLSRPQSYARLGPQGGFRQKCSGFRALGCQRAFLMYLDPGLGMGRLIHPLPPPPTRGPKPQIMKQRACVGSDQPPRRIE